ncbi:hypothetical protein VTN02DRAFT_2476 [Thermoascus thermophilus]
MSFQRPDQTRRNRSKGVVSSMMTSYLCMAVHVQYLKSAGPEKHINRCLLMAALNFLTRADQGGPGVSFDLGLEAYRDRSTMVAPCKVRILHKVRSLLRDAGSEEPRMQRSLISKSQSNHSTSRQAKRPMAHRNEIKAVPELRDRLLKIRPYGIFLVDATENMGPRWFQWKGYRSPENVSL